MARADSVHSTPPTNTSKIGADEMRSSPSRRGFLAIAGAAALVPSIASAADTDPILSVIATHKAHYEDLERTLNEQGRLEEALDSKKHVYKGDPSWIACDERVAELHELISMADCELISVEPTTVAGVLALFQYVVFHEGRGNEWNEAYSAETEDGQQGPYRSWHYHLLRNVLPVLSGSAVRT